MSLESAKQYLKQFNLEDRIQIFDVSSATVELAAKAVGVESARIAKTLSFKGKDHCILIVAAGDARIDNRKFKEEFGIKARMLTPDEVVSMVGHSIGGVCPFGIKDGVNVFIDTSVQRFASVFPAVGSGNSAIELSPNELFEVSRAQNWVSVCKIHE